MITQPPLLGALKPPSAPRPDIVYADPGGDAVQILGYFNALVGGTVTFDPTQKVVGVGSWKCDSGAGNDASRVSVNGVMGNNRRRSVFFRYDSVPDTEASLTEFAESPIEPYSGGGLASFVSLGSDDGDPATATPARNAGQGTVFGAFGFNSIPVGAIIDSVKIIYERSYDIDTSIGISRVKYRIDSVEGPDHDNTDEPLTDTVVEVDVTGDRSWERQDLLDAVFEVIVEARRGDTDIEHTQSWDFLKIEVVYHSAVQIWEALDVTNALMFSLALIPSGTGVRIRFIDGAQNSNDGITELAINEWHRIGYAFTNPEGVADDLHIKIYVESVPELDISAASTNGFVEPVNMRQGWCNPPGANKSCWFDQDCIDVGDDLADPGIAGKVGPLVTAKLPATVNVNDFDTTGGTGAVSERPVDLNNYRQQAATAQVSQNYKLQTAAQGDVSIAGKTVVGYVGWAIVKKVGPSGVFQLTLNGINTAMAFPTTPSRVQVPVTASGYPSDNAGIGVVSPTGSQDTFLYECGAVIVYFE